MDVYITMVLMDGSWEIVDAFFFKEEADIDAEALMMIEGFNHVKVHTMHVH